MSDELVRRARVEAKAMIDAHATMRMGYGVSEEPDTWPRREALFDELADRVETDAARIEALEAQVAAARELIALLEGEQARADSLARQIDVAGGALRLIDSISVHSGGEIHGTTAKDWQQGLEFAQRVASDAIAALTGEKP